MKDMEHQAYFNVACQWWLTERLAMLYSEDIFRLSNDPIPILYKNESAIGNLQVSYVEDTYMLYFLFVERNLYGTTR